LRERQATGSGKKSSQGMARRPWRSTPYELWVSETFPNPGSL
jgi:hypothetical protein